MHVWCEGGRRFRWQHSNNLFYSRSVRGSFCRLMKGAIMVRVIFTILIVCGLAAPVAAQPIALLVKDIRPGPAGSEPRDFVVVGDLVLFRANDGTHGEELWASDGSAAGTYLVKDINPGAGWSEPAVFARSGSLVYFRADDGVRGDELWVTDGTEAGTHIVKEICPGSGGGYPHSITQVNGILYFTADDGVYGKELWRSDGTEAGTYMIKDIFEGGSDSNPQRYTNAGGTVFFMCYDGIDIELWKTDGTEEGTVEIKDIYPGVESSFPMGLCNVDGTLFFSADDGTHGEELWKSDGTESGTVMVKDIHPGANDSNVMHTYSWNGLLLFSARGGYDVGQEPWVSDGTEAGTVLIEDIYPGELSAMPDRFKAFAGHVYLRAKDGICGSEMWRTDGTGMGTTMFMDLNSGSGSSHPIDLVECQGKLWFSAEGDGSDLMVHDLWMSDGTPGGTTPVFGSENTYARYLVSNGTTVLFRGIDVFHGDELWRVGTVSGVKGTPVPSVTNMRVYPNPFNSAARLNFTLHRGSRTTLDVYNIRGDFVTRLVDRWYEKGEHSITWDGRNTNGIPSASGIYLFYLKTADGGIAQKAVLLK